MININFFDSIISENKFTNVIEDYFNLDEFSHWLGFKVYRIEQGILVERHSELNSTCDKICRTAVNALKCLSYLTGVVPLAMLLGRIMIRQQLLLTIPDIDLDRSANPVSVQYDEYLAAMSEELSQKSAILCSTNYGSHWPECRLSLLDQVKSDPEVYFHVPWISVDQSFETLTHLLKVAFENGKKIAVFKIANQTHCECAAFDATGSFIILAGLSGVHVIRDLETFRQALNQRQIKNGSGEVMTFKGRYVATHLQQGGHECFRIATLYQYQIAKEKCLDAYKKVNGAFYDQQLQVFEDIEKIDQAREIEALLSPTASNNWEKAQYTFILSYICRDYGIERNRWEEITIADIVSNLSWTDYMGKPTDYHLFWSHKGCPLMAESCQVVDKSKKIFVDPNSSLGDLFADHSSQVILSKDGPHFKFSDTFLSA